MSDTSNEPTTPLRPRERRSLAKGNRGGPATPFAAKSRRFRAALMEAVTEQDIKDIAVKLRDDAKAGDKAAVNSSSSTSSRQTATRRRLR